LKVVTPMAETTVSYKCPNCSAPLSFLPGHDKVSCEYCGNEFSVQTVKEMFAQEEARAVQARAEQESTWATDAAGGEWQADEAAALRSFTCSSCGAEIVADENTMATECCYCGNPTMIPQRFSGMMKPDYVIPFKKNKKEAVAALKKFYEGKILLPDAFVKNNRVESIQPMYVPFWLFDSDVSGSASYRAENVRTYETDDERITETDVYSCFRSGDMHFDRVPVDGSNKMDNVYMESVEPFNYRDMVAFEAGYLTGYLADKYDVDAADSVPRADERVRGSVSCTLQNTVTGYDSVTEQELHVVKDKSEVSYALMPVWILTTRYENKPYTFMMNGQTGKIVGSLPYDRTKAILYPAIVTLIALPILYLLADMFLSS